MLIVKLVIVAVSTFFIAVYFNEREAKQKKEIEKLIKDSEK